MVEQKGLGFGLRRLGPNFSLVTLVKLFYYP